MVRTGSGGVQERESGVQGTSLEERVIKNGGIVHIVELWVDGGTLGIAAVAESLLS